MGPAEKLVSAMQFQDVKLRSVHLETSVPKNQDAAINANPNANCELGFDGKVLLNSTNEQTVIVTTFSAKLNTAIGSIHLSMEGQFLAPELLQQRTINQGMKAFVEGVAFPTVAPFMRETIHSLTQKAFIQPLVLPYYEHQPMDLEFPDVGYGDSSEENEGA